MIIKYSQKQYLNTKSNSFLLLECEFCHEKFMAKKKEITYVLKHHNDKRKTKTNMKFCSRKCHIKFQTKKEKLNCLNCNKSFFRALTYIKKSKSKNYFCSKSCSATYNNLHKKYGVRRSKLEKWLEQQLNELYSNLEILYNDKSTINSELDIYIPSLKLAIEINGIFHYEPIFGESKLQQIQNNDQRKHQACYEQGIEILWIDTSSLKYFKSKNAQKYLDIITDVINNLSNS